MTTMTTMTRPRLAEDVVVGRATIIAIYARISRDRDNDHDGVRRQEAAVRKLTDKLAH